MGEKVDELVRERVDSLRHFTHIERFLKRPFLNASLAPASADDAADGATAAELALMVSANPNLEILGTNADDAGVEALEGGGVRFETAGADGDGHILLAHLDANQSALASVNWDTRNEPLFYANIVSGPDAADITNCIMWAGWKLTNTATTATDADQAFFRYENGVNGGRWQAIVSTGGTDSVYDTGATVAAATNYRMLIAFDAARRPHMYLNEAVVTPEMPPAVTALATFEFYIGVEADGAAEAKELDIRSFVVSQLYG